MEWASRLGDKIEERMAEAITASQEGLEERITKAVSVALGVTPELHAQQHEFLMASNQNLQFLVTRIEDLGLAAKEAETKRARKKRIGEEFSKLASTLFQATGMAVVLGFFGLLGTFLGYFIKQVFIPFIINKLGSL
jgi:urease accessory protein UreF